MQLDTTAALVTAILSAGIGFGLAFYFEKKLNGNSPKTSTRVLVFLAMTFFGVGLSGFLNELIGFPLQGLPVRMSKLLTHLLLNMLFMPAVLLGIAKLFVKEESTKDSQSDVVSQTQVNVDSSKRKKQTNQSYNSEKSDDEELYEMAHNEFNSNKRRKGLYLKMLTQQNGNEEKARYEYIKARVAELTEESNNRQALEAERKAKAIKEEGDSTKLIAAGLYRKCNVGDVKCILIGNGQAAIVISDGVFRIYEDENTMEKSAKYYSSMGQYLMTGFVQTFDSSKEKIIPKTKTIQCRKCEQKIRIKNLTGMIECPNCSHEWLHEKQ